MAIKTIQVADKPTLDNVSNKIDSLNTNIPALLDQKTALISKNVMNTSDTVIQMPYNGNIAVGDIVRYNSTTDEVYASSYMSDTGLISSFSNTLGAYDKVIKNPNVNGIYYGVKIQSQTMTIDTINVPVEAVSSKTYSVSGVGEIYYNFWGNVLTLVIKYTTDKSGSNQPLHCFQIITISLTTNGIIDKIRDKIIADKYKQTDFYFLGFLENKYVLFDGDSYLEIFADGTISSTREMNKTSDSLSYSLSKIDGDVDGGGFIWNADLKMSFNTNYGIKKYNSDSSTNYYYNIVYNSDMTYTYTYIEGSYSDYTDNDGKASVFQINNDKSICNITHYSTSNGFVINGEHLVLSDTSSGIERKYYLKSLSIKNDSKQIGDIVNAVYIDDTSGLYSSPTICVKYKLNDVITKVAYTLDTSAVTAAETTLNSKIDLDKLYIDQYYLSNTLFTISSSLYQIQYTSSVPVDSIYGICKAIDSENGIANIAMSGICKTNKSGTKGQNLPNLGTYITKYYINLTEILN